MCLAPFSPQHQPEFCGCLQPLFLFYRFYFSELQEGTEASEKATEPLRTEVRAFCRHSSRSCTLVSGTLATPAISPCHLPAEGTEALIRPARLPCRNGKRVWCGNHDLGSTAQGCMAPKYLPSPPDMYTEDAILLQKSPLLHMCSAAVPGLCRWQTVLASAWRNCLPSWLRPTVILLPQSMGHSHAMAISLKPSTFLISLAGF